MNIQDQHPAEIAELLAAFNEKTETCLSVDVTGLVIYFSVASLFLTGKLL